VWLNGKSELGTATNVRRIVDLLSGAVKESDREVQDTFIGFTASNLLGKQLVVAVIILLERRAIVTLELLTPSLFAVAFVFGIKPSGDLSINGIVVLFTQNQSTTKHTVVIELGVRFYQFRVNTFTYWGGDLKILVFHLFVSFFCGFFFVFPSALIV